VACSFGDMRGHVGSGVRSHLPESDGISDKFDYVKLRNDAQNLPECQLNSMPEWRCLDAAIAGPMCLAWLIVFHVLSVHPYLVEDGIDPDFFPKERFRATLGVILYAIAGVAGCLSTPKAPLLIFPALPVFYGVTSEGLTETRIRLQFRTAHRRAIAKSSQEGLRTE
jgi:hypothetical protein